MRPGRECGRCPTGLGIFFGQCVVVWYPLRIRTSFPAPQGPTAPGVSWMGCDSSSHLGPGGRLQPRGIGGCVRPDGIPCSCRHPCRAPGRRQHRELASAHDPCLRPRLASRRRVSRFGPLSTASRSLPISTGAAIARVGPHPTDGTGSTSATRGATRPTSRTAGR